MENKSRIIYVIGTLDIGGTEKHLTQVIRNLDKKKWEIKVFCFIRKGLYAKSIEECGIEVVSPVFTNSIRAGIIFRSIRLMIAVFFLMKLFISSRPVIIHFFLPGSYLFAAPLALLCRIKYLIMSRRSLNHYQNKRPNLVHLEYWLHKRMDAILGNSRAVIEQLHSEENVPRTKLALIYNGIDISEMSSEIPRDAIRKRLNILSKSIVLITIANLIPYKGHADLLYALQTIKNQLNLSWHLLCVGRDDGIGNDLIKLSKDFGIRDHVQFLGQRNDIPDLLNASDIGILCSHQEGFSNFILEAMSTGLPVIATDVGGNSEAVINNETGLIVPPKNVEKLSKAILRLIFNPVEARSMGKKGKTRVQSNFSLVKCINQYEKLYSGLIEGRQPSEIFAQDKNLVS